MPVAVVRLALVEVVGDARQLLGGYRRRAHPTGCQCRHPALPGIACRTSVTQRVHLVRHAQHLLVEVVDLPVVDLEAAPEAAAHPACLRPALLDGVVEQVRELAPRLHRQRPFAHLRVGAGRQVHATDGRVRHEGLGWLQQRQPVPVLLQRAEEPLDPLSTAVAELPGARPRAELLAVVTHHAHQPAVLRGVFAEVRDDVLDGPEGDAVAETLLGAVDDDAVALVVRGVAAPVALGGDGGGAEVGVVHDGVRVAGLGQGGGHVRFPDPLGQPGADGPPPEERLHLVGHARQLAHAVRLAQ